MSWNTSNFRERIAIGGKRRIYRLDMAWAWIQKNNPEVAIAIEEESARLYPFLPGKSLGASVAKKVTDGLALVERKTK